MNKRDFEIMKKRWVLATLVFLLIFLLVTLTSTSFLTNVETSLSPTCGDDVCESPETEFSCPLDCNWPKSSHKIKAMFDMASDPIAYPNETLLDLYLSNGINTIISHQNGELYVAYFNFSKYNYTSMPRGVTNYSLLAVSKNYSYFSYIKWDFNASQRGFSGQTFEKTVLDTGETLDEVNPWDQTYWNNVTEIMVRVAKFAAVNPGTHKIEGIFVNPEFDIYNGWRNTNDSWGYANSTWWAYIIEKRGITNISIINRSYEKRRDWLIENNSLNDFNYFLHNLSYQQAKTMKDKVAEVNPNFLIGHCYPPVGGYSYLKYVDRGWSSPNSPTVMWSGDVYGGGAGAEAIPRTINNSALIRNRYYNLTPTYNEEIYGYYPEGLIIGQPWFSTNFTGHVLPLANATSGYWIWNSGIITASCESLINGYYESRLPVNCDTDFRNPGCCVNNRNFPDANWLTECCPNYPTTVNKLWGDINKTNHKLDLLGMFNGTIPECADEIDNDIDNKTDYPNDPGCTDIGDNSEYSDSDSWWKMKGIFGFESEPASQQEFMNNLTLAASYGFNVIQSYDGVDNFLIYLNRSSPSGALMRQLKIKVMVPVGGMGGVLERSINETTKNISFVVRNISEFDFNIMGGDYYSNSSNRTIWLDGECIKFDNFTISRYILPGYAYGISRATLNGVIRGYCSPATAHTNGTFEINKEIIQLRMRQYVSPDFSDAIWGYWAMDDAPIAGNLGWAINFSYAEKTKEEIIRSIDPDPSKPVVWGYGVDYGISDFRYIEGDGVYVYPWKGSAYGYANHTQTIIDQYNYIRSRSDSTKIFPIAQTYGTGYSNRLPTETELRKEIILHKSLGADSIFFYDWISITNNSLAFYNGRATEDWKKVLRNIPLGSLTASFTTQIISDKRIAFNASSSSPGHGPILNYTWSFGDGTNGSGEYIEHQYATDGTYQVSLKISNPILNEFSLGSAYVQTFLPIQPSNGGGGSGSGDGGGAATCTPGWSCSDWSKCANSIQERDCLDTNNCNTLVNKPETIRACNEEQLVAPGDEEENQDSNQEITILPGVSLPRIFVYSLLGIAVVLATITTIVLIKIKR